MLFKKDIALPLDKFISLVKPKYVYLQITPHKATRNYNSTNIAKAIAHTYKAINKRISIEKKKLRIETNYKISYVIDIKNKNTNFYFIVPEVFVNIIIEKVREIWPKVELNVTDKIDPFGPTTEFYQLNYKKEDALSLQVDKKSNDPLNSILSVLEIMQEDDRVTLVYNFLPKNQFNWSKRYESIIEKIHNMQPIDKDHRTPEYFFKSLLTFLNYIFNSLIDVLNDFSGTKKEVNTVLSELLITSNIMEVDKRLSDSTKLKKEKTVLDAQILLASDSNDKTRQENNAHVVSQAFRVVDEDNELISKKVSLKENESIHLEDYKFNHVGENTFSVDECQNFLQQPGRALMNSLGINHIQVEECEVPEKLKKGYINLGTVKFKGTTKTAYLEDDYDIGSLPLILNGSQGSGKSTFIANMHRYAHSRKEGGLLIDFIKKNELTEEVKNYIPSEDLIILDYSNPLDIQGFAFNELSSNIEGLSAYDKIKFANLQAQQVLELINAINDDNQSLAARMRKYLIAAATVVFSTGESSLKEVVNCLEDWEIRHKYIELIEGEEKEFLEDKIKILQELDDWSKPTKDNPVPEIIGTKESRIDGILDRISLLKEDFSLEFMFNKGSKNNIDIAKEMENGKLIVIKMLQNEFSAHAKNVITTFFISKLWMATEIRGKWSIKPKRTYATIDEIFQTPTAMRMLAKKNILPQTRKFGLKFCTTCQTIAQLDVLMDTLEGAGASFMLLRGSKEEDFKQFESKLEGYEYEDLRDMAKYNSLNLIYYSSGYASFISQLPPPLKASA